MNKSTWTQELKDYFTKKETIIYSATILIFAVISSFVIIFEFPYGTVNTIFRHAVKNNLSLLGGVELFYTGVMTLSGMFTGSQMGKTIAFALVFLIMSFLSFILSKRITRRHVIILSVIFFVIFNLFLSITIMFLEVFS